LKILKAKNSGNFQKLKFLGIAELELVDHSSLHLTCVCKSSILDDTVNGLEPAGTPQGRSDDGIRFFGTSGPGKHQIHLLIITLPQKKRNRCTLQRWYFGMIKRNYDKAALSALIIIPIMLALFVLISALKLLHISW